MFVFQWSYLFTVRPISLNTEFPDPNDITIVNLDSKIHVPMRSKWHLSHFAHPHSYNKFHFFLSFTINSFSSFFLLLMFSSWYLFFFLLVKYLHGFCWYFVNASSIFVKKTYIFWNYSWNICIRTALWKVIPAVFFTHDVWLYCLSISLIDCCIIHNKSFPVSIKLSFCCFLKEREREN